MRPGARALLGQGVFVMTLDRGPDFERTQGITPIEGESLSLAAEHYFQQSEQIPTKVRLAVGEVSTEAGRSWRAGGALIQLIAGDEARGIDRRGLGPHPRPVPDPGDDELLDPTMTPETLLFRLFHEDGVRLEDARALVGRLPLLQGPHRRRPDLFTPEERADMVEADGKIRVTCEYCATVYELEPEEVVAG